jgi:hypothetical protein
MRLPLVKNLRTWSAATAVVGLTACAAIVGLEDGNSANVSSAYDAGPDRTPPPPPPPPSKCKSAGLPPEPINPKNKEFALPVLVSAATDVRVSNVTSNTESGQSGYDLDGFCTCTEDAVSGKQIGASCKSSGPVADQCDEGSDAGSGDAGPPQGIDNSLANIFNNFPKIVDISKVLNYRCIIGRGSSTVLYTLGQYNGEEDDDEVFFSYVNPRRFLPEPQGAERGAYAGRQLACTSFANQDVDGGPLRCDESANVVRSDGCDTWDYPKEHAVSVDTFGAFLTLQKGYVRGGYLVVKYSNPTTVTLGDLVVSGADTWITSRIELLDKTGKLVKFGSPEVVEARRSVDDKTVKLQNASNIRVRLRDGLQVGRLNASQLYRATGQIRYPGLAGTICEDEDVRSIMTNTIRPQICRFRDLTASVSRDGQGLECDSVSYALRFEAEPAYFGAPQPMPTVDPGPCLLKKNGVAVPDSGLAPLDCTRF